MNHKYDDVEVPNLIALGVVLGLGLAGSLFILFHAVGWVIWLLS